MKKCSNCRKTKKRSNLLKKVLCLLHFDSSSGDLKNKRKSPHLNSWLVFAVSTFLEKCLLSICLQREKLTRMPRTWGEYTHYTLYSTALSSSSTMLITFKQFHIIPEENTHTANFPAVFFVFVCWQIQMQISWVGRSTNTAPRWLITFKQYHIILDGPTWRRTSSMRAVSALVESSFNNFPRRGRQPCISIPSATTATSWSSAGNHGLQWLGSW